VRFTVDGEYLEHKGERESSYYCDDYVPSLFRFHWFPPEVW